MPRTEVYRIPNNQVKIFQGESKKSAKGPFDCPRCSKHQLLIVIDKNTKEVFAKCSSCRLLIQLRYAPVFQAVDYYYKICYDFKKANQFG